MLTVASVETYLTTTLAGWLSKTKPLMSTVHDGTNADLAPAISTAVRVLGYTVAGTSVTDADLASVADAKENALLQVATYYALQAVLFRFSAVDQKEGPDAASYSQLRKDLMGFLKDLWASISLQFGIGRPKGRTAVGALTAGAWPPPPPPPIPASTPAGYRQWPPVTADDETLKPVNFNP